MEPNAKRRRLLLQVDHRPWPRDKAEWTKEDFASAVMVNTLHLEPSLAARNYWMHKSRRSPMYSLASMFLPKRIAKRDNSDLIIALDLQVPRKLQLGPEELR
jgi:hypothetical protein